MSVQNLALAALCGLVCIGASCAGVHRVEPTEATTARTDAGQHWRAAMAKTSSVDFENVTLLQAFRVLQEETELNYMFDEAKVAFSLAFVTHPEMPEAVFLVFPCMGSQAHTTGCRSLATASISGGSA